MRNLIMGCTVIALMALSARTEARSPELKTLPTTPALSLAGRAQIGLASWYGSECEGSLTASGALFDENALTCAHRELPLGTKVKVTNLRNHRSLVLKVNDRGPSVPGRVLDVSKAAAQQLGFLHSGLTPVRIQVVSCPRGALMNQAAANSAVRYSE